MSFESIVNLTLAQLEFLLTVENKDDQQADSRKAADRHGCGIILKIMKRTGWTALRLLSIPPRILCDFYAVENGGKQPGVVVIQSQLNAFFKKLSRREARPDKPKIKRRYSHE
jgi:hypothetical protein